MKCGKLFSRQPSFFYSVLALLALLLIPGRTLLWSQSSEPSSRNSAGHLRTWEELSNKFASTLELHEHTLNELGQKLKTSEASLQELTTLYELSSQQNERLKTYNGQIAERMQERDEDLAASYEEIDRKGRTVLKLVIALILLAIPYLVWIVVKFKPG